MAYTGFYNSMPGLVSPIGSRASAVVYPGQICPQSAEFGYTHGPAPAIGSIKFTSEVVIPLGQNVMIQIGQSAFFGILHRGLKDYSTRSGRSTTYTMSDWRDRLHDIHHFAQYNMGDDKGRRWHILPKFWRTQQRTFITSVETLEQMTERQELTEYDLDLYDTCPFLFSAFSILAYLALRYDFTFTWTEYAGEFLFRTYPVDLNWNTGKKVIDCIDEVLNQCNLQFTAFGNLNLHITRKGFPETYFEQVLQAGLINLCQLQGQVDSSLGAELNDKGRRITILGSNNKHEYWYPCLPDWNPLYTWDMVNDSGGLFSTLLIKYGLTRLDTMSRLPYRWQDRQTFNGKKRNDMTIGDYIEQIPFKVYRVDFGFPLEKPQPWNANGEFTSSRTFDPSYMFLLWRYRDFIKETVNNEIGLFDSDATSLRLRFLWFEYQYIGVEENPFGSWNGSIDGFNTPTDVKNRSFSHIAYLDWNTIGENDPGDYQFIRSWHYLDSPYPISSHIVSDDSRQFIAMATSRATHVKGNRTMKNFAQGIFTYITDGVSLDVQSYVVPRNFRTNMRNETWGNLYQVDNNEFGDVPEAGKIRFGGEDYDDELQCRERWWAKVVFTERRYAADVVEREIPPDPAKGTGSKIVQDFVSYPDRVFVKLSQDREIYSYTFGDDYGQIRVREIIRSAPDLHRPTVEFVEQPVIRNPNSLLDAPPPYRVTNPSNLYVDEVAQQIAIQELNHEFITSAGHITFRGNAGFTPSGLIDSVRVTFDSKAGRSGTREVINFTNVKTDERVNRIIKIERKTKVVGELEIYQERMKEWIKEAIKDINNNVGNNKALNPALDNAQVNVQAAIGKDGVANVKVDMDDLGDDEVLEAGELIFVKSSTSAPSTE